MTIKSVNRMFTFLFFLFSLAFSDISCKNNELHVRMTLVTRIAMGNEYFYIIDKEDILFGDSSIQGQSRRNIDTCIPQTTNNQYSLLLFSTQFTSGSWYPGSSLQIYGLYDNLIFKGALFPDDQAIFPLSFYTPIMKNEQWKFSSTITSNWYDKDYNDDSWTVESLGTSSTTVAGTQYFRKEFAGLSAMAAYEVSFNYRYGIVAYMNGIEIFRDNMPGGEPTTTTAATSGYPSISYRSVIRPANEVSDEECTLAVELHFLSGNAIAIHFNAFLAIYASSHDANCYVYPYGVTVSGPIWDWNIGSSFSQSYPGISKEFVLDGNHIMYINGIRQYYSKSNNRRPTSFSLVSSNHHIIDINSYVYKDTPWNTKRTLFTGHLASNATFNVFAVSGGGLSLFEIHFLTCNLDNNNTIVFPQSVYTYYAIYNSISISPVSDEIVNCSISPQVPSGLVFNSTTCTLSGKVVTSSTTVFTVTSLVNGQLFTGSFTLKFESCTGSYLRIQRTISLLASKEAYTLRELSTNKIISQGLFDKYQSAMPAATSFVCVSGGMYELTLNTAFCSYSIKSYLILDILLSEEDVERLGKFTVDFILGTPSVFTFSLDLQVPPYSNWYYKMGSVPANWYTSTTSGWSIGKKFSFEDSTNQIQLYKKTFRVSSMDNAVSIGIHIRFQHGIILYLNNEEMYRKGVDGELSISSFASSSYPSLCFHSIYLPTVTLGTSTQPSRSVIHVGSNTLAIALVAVEAQQVQASFDCVVRVTDDSSTNRAFGSSVTLQNVQVPFENSDPFTGLYNRIAFSKNCNSNYIDLIYENDRREWISLIILQNWYAYNDQNIKTIRIEAKNPEDTSFTVLKEVSNLTWSHRGQSKRIWLINNQPYNQYRFSNIGTGDPSNCNWTLNRISLHASRIDSEVPALQYPSPLITCYAHIEIAEIYPNSDLYHSFSIIPDLPAGILLDPDTGVIFGTPQSEQPAQSYTVTASTYTTGEAQSTTISLEVESCSGGKSLITMMIRTDSTPDLGAYKLFRGKGIEGSLVTSMDSFPYYNSLFYSDFCLPHDLYTVQAISNNPSGWGSSSGILFSVDAGSLRFDVHQVKSTLTSSFSSYLPFQMTYDYWRVYNATQPVPSSWKQLDFDDSSWSFVKAADIGVSQCTTVYTRRTFTIASIEDYNVLNVQIKYTGGVVAYFNGRRVARFNLEDPFASTSKSITVHPADSFSKFHIILEANGGRNGTNVMAFEIHKAKGESSTLPVIFDATGVFGVNDCSILVDSFESLTSSSTTGTTILEMWSLAPFYSGFIENRKGAYIEWIVENLEGSRFNSFGILTSQTSDLYSFSVYCFDASDTRISILHEEDQVLLGRERNAYYSALGLMGVRRFRFESDSVSVNPIYVSSYMTQYCKVSGQGTCVTEGDHVSVYEGELSIGRCEESFSGYSYRACSNGQLGAIQNDMCLYKQPAFLEYPSPLYTFVKGVENESSAPLYVNAITTFSVRGYLPNGFEFDQRTGILRGIPTTVSLPQTLTVTGSNPIGLVETTITFQVREAQCEGEGVWNSTTVGTVLSYRCKHYGKYVGTQKRACILGKRDGEWQPVKGTCYSIQYVIILIISIIAFMCLVACCIMKIRQQNKKNLHIRKVVMEAQLSQFSGIEMSFTICYTHESE